MIQVKTGILRAFPFGSAGTESAYNVGNLGSSPGLERSAGEGKSYPLQYSGLENSMDSVVQGVTKSWTQLSDFQKKIMKIYYFFMMGFSIFRYNCKEG